MGDAERGLWAAVMAQAIRDIKGASGLDCKQRESARHSALDWFASDDWDRVNSFRNICAVLGLNYQAIRAGVRKIASEAGAI